MLENWKTEYFFLLYTANAEFTKLHAQDAKVSME